MRQLHVVDGSNTSDEALEALMGVSISILESRNGIVQVGAGISTNAGIPDFRSSSKGIYSGAANASTRLNGSSNPSVKDLFSYSSLLDPETRSAHVKFMNQLHQQTSTFHPTSRGSPTVFHDLMKRLDDMKKLLRAYSQNVDGFEGDAGLDFVNLEDNGDKVRDKANKASTEDSEGEGTSEWEASNRGKPPRKRRKLSRSPSTSDHSHDWSKLPRSHRVVAMHGSLRSVVCSACGWTGDWDDKISRKFEKGKRVNCPRCEERAKVRLSASKRPLPPSSLSFLRPNLLLYDDPSSSHSSHLSSLSSLSTFDLSSTPDFLLVAGTSLQIPGFKQLVKEFAKEVKANGGICVLVNREAVAASWNTVFDIEFRMDVDAFATILLSNLVALSPSSRIPSISTVEENSSSSSRAAVLNLRQTPSPPRSAQHKKVPAVSHLPTPSPTPSLSHALALDSSPSFFGPIEFIIPSSASPPPASIEAQSKPPVCDHHAHLPSPPPTSSPVRSRSTSRSRARPLTPSLVVEDLAFEGFTESDSVMELEEEPEEEEERLIGEKRTYSAEESRSLVDVLLQQAQAIWEASLSSDGE